MPIVLSCADAVAEHPLTAKRGYVDVIRKNRTNEDLPAPPSTPPVIPPLLYSCTAACVDDLFARVQAVSEWHHLCSEDDVCSSPPPPPPPPSSSSSSYHRALDDGKLLAQGLSVAKAAAAATAAAESSCDAHIYDLNAFPTASMSTADERLSTYLYTHACRAGVDVVVAYGLLPTAVVVFCPDVFHPLASTFMCNLYNVVGHT